MTSEIQTSARRDASRGRARGAGASPPRASGHRRNDAARARGRPRADRRFRQPGDAADRAGACARRASIPRSCLSTRRKRRLRPMPPKAIILSGGPASVHETGTPQAPQALFNAGVPVLGICYGEQAMVAALGGAVEGGHEREFGRAELQIIDETPLFDGVFQVGERAPVWMSHGDRVTRLPPGFRAVGISTGAPFAAIADDSRRLYGVQFHPEVVHTPKGAALLANFVHAHRRLRRRLDHGAVPRERGRPHPRAGGRRARDLRAVGRGRFGRRRAPDPRGDRRPAHLHLRRSRPAAAGRGGGGRRAVPRPLQHPAGRGRCERALPRCARTASPTPKSSAR